MLGSLSNRMPSFIKRGSKTGMSEYGGGGFGSSDDKHMVEVPPGVKPGDTLRVKLPDGDHVSVTVPPDARAGTMIEVEKTKYINVAVPQGAKPGDTMQVRDEATGVSLAFTVPKGTKPGSTVRVAVPASELRETGGLEDEDDRADVEVATRKAVVPAGWDGRSPISTEVDGRVILFQPPLGAVPGDAVLLDVPPTNAKVRLTLTVPGGVLGGEIVAVRSPSGHLKLVTLPTDATPGTSVTVRIADEPDAAEAAGGALGSAVPQQRAVLKGRAFSAKETFARMGPGKSKPQPIFVTLSMSSMSSGGAGGGGGVEMSVPSEHI